MVFININYILRKIFKNPSLQQLLSKSSKNTKRNNDISSETKIYKIYLSFIAFQKDIWGLHLPMCQMNSLTSLYISDLIFLIIFPCLFKYFIFSCLMQFIAFIQNITDKNRFLKEILM